MKIKRSELKQLAIKHIGNDSIESQNLIMLKIATARAARVSYTIVGQEKEHNYEKDIALHDELFKSGHCFDAKTQILTDKGWKYINKVLYTDNIAQVNIKTGEFAGFSTPTNIIEKDYNGKVYNYIDSNIDLFITEGHKLLGVPINVATDRKKSYESLEVFEANKERITKASKAVIKYKTYGEQELIMFSAPKPIKINKNSKEYLKGCLYGFFVGDGYTENAKKIKFRLKVTRKIEYIQTIFKLLNIAYVLKIDKDGVSCITAEVDEDFRVFYNNKSKTIPYIKYSIETLYGLFDGLKNSDGSIKRNTWVYDTTSKLLHDRILELCPLVGLTGYSNESYLLQKLVKNQNIRYRIGFTTNNHIKINDSRKSDKRVKIFNYTGKVYCVEVPEKGIIIRKNEKPCIIHNCSPFEHCARAMDWADLDNYAVIEDGNVIPGICRNFKGWIQYRATVEPSQFEK